MNERGPIKTNATVAVVRALVFLFPLAQVALQAGQVFHVAQSASGAATNGSSWQTAFRAVQGGIDAAQPGDEIRVAAGVYKESVRLKEGVALIGGFAGTEINRTQRDWNVHRTILDGQGSQSVVLIPPEATSATRLDGFTIRNGHADYGAGIYSGGGSPVIANCTVANNNAPGYLAGSAVFSDTAFLLAPQTPLTFFTNVADRLFQSRSTGLRSDRIEIYPTNRYTAEVHQLLHLAANLYDATTNRGASYPYFPSVFRPVFTNDNDTVLISGFVEADNADFLTNIWLDLEVPADRAQLTDDLVRSNANIFGQPIVIGVKKGFPNFNEFYLQSSVQVTRRLQAEKRFPADTQPVIRQAYELGISNFFGLEAWNSYTSAFPSALEIRVTNRATVTLTVGDGPVSPPLNTELTYTFNTNILAGDWMPEQFLLPLSNLVVSLPDSQFYFLAPNFRPMQTNVAFENVTGFPIPDWKLFITNRVQFVLLAETQDGTKRIVDFVNLEDLNGSIDITRALVGTTNLFQDTTNAFSFWLTNRVGGVPPGPTAGITNQLFVSTTDALSDAEWRSLSLYPFSGQQKEKAVDGFRQFLGMSPIFSPTNPTSPGLFVQAPFTPTRKLDLQMSWQVNDPLVHYHIEDVRDPFYANTNNIRVMRPVDAPEPSNLGRLNRRFRPWGGFPGTQSSDAFNTAVKDAFIRRSDDWEFPSEPTVNVRWLDRVHRGTPWQTVYFGSIVENPSSWVRWSGSPATHPTNDWSVIDLFLARDLGLVTSSVSTAAPVIVNNTIAANKAASVGSAVYVAPGATPTLANNIVSFNTAGIFKQGNESMTLRTNAVFGNGAFDYSGVTAGAGDVAVDPQFVSPANGNFDLLASSPCLDIGDDGVFTSGWLFGDEAARRVGAHLDIGAYELSPESPPAITAESFDTSTGSFGFTLHGYTGRSFVVERSGDLITWMPVFTNTTVNGFFDFTDPDGALLARRFYRGVTAQ